MSKPVLGLLAGLAATSALGAARGRGSRSRVALREQLEVLSATLDMTIVELESAAASEGKAMSDKFRSSADYLARVQDKVESMRKVAAKAK